MQVDRRPNEDIERARLALSENDAIGEGWDRVMFTFSLSFASRHVLAAGNWDEDRRQSLRRIIGQARQNFHLHPRPW